MNNEFITYTNIKYNFTYIIDIQRLTEKNINKFNELYYSDQISKKDYDIIINLIYNK